MQTVTFQLQTLTCPSCINKITNGVKALPGVKNVEVLFNSSRVKVQCDKDSCNPKDIKQTITKLGYEVIDEK